MPVSGPEEEGLGEEQLRGCEAFGRRLTLSEHGLGACEPARCSVAEGQGPLSVARQWSLRPGSQGTRAVGAGDQGEVWPEAACITWPVLGPEGPGIGQHLEMTSAPPQGWSDRLGDRVHRTVPVQEQTGPGTPCAHGRHLRQASHPLWAQMSPPIQRGKGTPVPQGTFPDSVSWGLTYKVLSPLLL